jgi:hypothetical protein
MDDDNINVATHRIANLLTIYEALKRPVGVGLDTAVSATTPSTSQSFGKFTEFTTTD